VTDFVEIENRAGIARTTCGWPKSSLDREAIRRYWRDVHSPAISRRAGVYQYRHSPFDPVAPDVFDAVAGVETSCPADRQIQWQSDVVYLDEAGMAEFMRSPADPEVMALLLGDIEMIVDKSTTYKALGANLHTYVDRTGDPTPLGPVTSPRYGVFFRQRAGVAESDFRAVLRALAQAWADAAGVLRVRMNLFEVPDMEAERKAGYPVKTHPVELQYQAWVDLVLDDAGAARPLLQRAGIAEVAAEVHAYPVPAMYTFVFGGRPTLAGIRGYAAHDAIETFGADHQKDRRLLEWMYGGVIHGSNR
jgi:hypothetical protein